MRDTSDFLQKIGDIKSLTGNEILATLDVSSLYTNIPNDEGCQATYQAPLKSRGPEINPSNLSIIEMLSQVLTYNNFKFNDRHYLQIGGTAMGTKLAPSYANIFMSDFEDKHVYTYRLQPLLWLRYIDDVFCIWQHGKEQLDDFIQHLNSVHRSIKFTVVMWYGLNQSARSKPQKPMVKLESGKPLSHTVADRNEHHV